MSERLRQFMLAQLEEFLREDRDDPDGLVKRFMRRLTPRQREQWLLDYDILIEERPGSRDTWLRGKRLIQQVINEDAAR